MICATEMATIRPIFCGNFEYDARSSEIERLFVRYGKVERVDMKSGKEISLKFEFGLLLFRDWE